MKAKITSDKKFIQITEYTDLEIEQLQFSFKKRIDAWRWSPLVKSGRWDGYIRFVDRYNRIPVGLWHELNVFCNKFEFELSIEGFSQIVNLDFDRTEFENWVNDFFKDHPKITPYDYQVESAINILKYKRSSSEIATSAGKTLIIFMVFAYLMHKGDLKKFMIIVPSTNLILQTIDDFSEYDPHGKLEYKLQPLHGGTTKKKENSDIIIGTYQSLVKRPADWFDEVDVICVDECHHTHAQSIKTIITKCSNINYTFGVSGTLKAPDGSAGAFTIQAYLGPIVNDISAKFLINNNYATGIFVKVVILDYLDDELKQKLQELRERKNEFEGTKLLDLEKRVVHDNRRRFVYVCDFISKVSKNSLVFFSDVKNGYGRRIYDYLRNNTNKHIFYVDGGTPPKLREEYFARMEIGSDCIIVCTFGTLGTGISINNIHNIFFVESYKSDRIIRQSIGRGMRLRKNKNKVMIIDFVDDFKYVDDNYLYKHGKDRMRTYREQGFPYKKYKVKF